MLSFNKNGLWFRSQLEPSGPPVAPKPEDPGSENVSMDDLKLGRSAQIKLKSNHLDLFYLNKDDSVHCL